MKKQILYLLAAAFIFVSCAELTRNNPYDPNGGNYVGITFKGEAKVEDNTSPKSMCAEPTGRIILGSFKGGTGDVLFKVEDNGASQQIGPAGVTPVVLAGLSDLVYDSISGNTYITDGTSFIRIMDSGNNFLSYIDIPFSAAVAGSSIEIFNDGTADRIYLTNPADKTIIKFSQAGAVIDNITLTVTASAYFTAGRLFKSDTHIYAVNTLNKQHIVKFDGDLNIVSEHFMAEDIIDGVKAGGFIQLLSSRAVYKVDSDLNVVLKWGDFGEGPGRVINGELIAYKDSNKYVYIIDGDSLKYFGE